MVLNKASSRDIKEINQALAPNLIKDPLFMFFSQNINKRADFIDAYLNYYIYEWSRYDTLLCDEGKQCLISLVDPDTFAYKYKGKGAIKMRSFKDSSTVFVHRENVASIVEILIPPTRESRVMTIYGNCDKNLNDIVKLIDEAMEMAKNEKFILIYETFSKKLINLMLSKGFSIASQKQFLNTQFIETVMTFNV